MSENRSVWDSSPLDNLNGDVRHKGTVSSPPAERLSEMEVLSRNWAANALIQNVDNVTAPADVVVRDLHPHLDLESGADNGWNGSNHEFLQSGLSADQLNETYLVDENGKAENKAIVFYAVSNTAAAPLTTSMRFRNVTGGIFEHLQLEDSVTDEDTTAAFVRPMVIRPGETVTIEQWADAAGDDEVLFHGVTAEAAGRTLKGQYE